MPSAAYFRVDPRLASLLGETYRSSEHSIKELVDNAWDADAEHVWITLPQPMTADPIIVRDDGTGMVQQEVRQEYLTVAKDRTIERGVVTARKHRPVKGRKGIGKFAGLTAAGVMRVESFARGRGTTLTVHKDELSDVRDLERFPLPLETSECEPDKHGTTVTLSELSQTLAFPDADKLKHLLIREYGRETDFEVFVNDSPVRIDDMPGESFCEEAELPDIGRVRLQLKITDDKAVKNPGVALRVASKIVGKPTCFGLESAEDIPPKLLKRVYGEVQADGLANDVTADWGAVIENSKAYETVQKWVGSKLRTHIEATFRREVNLARARIQQEINRRLADMPEHRRNFARLALERVMQRFYGESEDRIKPIVSVVLDALERDEYWVVIHTIKETSHSDVAAFAEALASFGLLELAMMSRQATQRLEFLDELDQLISNPKTIEKDIHRALENNLWVLGAHYALLASNKTLVGTIEAYTGQKFTGDRAHRRPDLLLLGNVNHEYLLIEFKRPNHRVTRDDENQAENYRDDLISRFSPMRILVVGGEYDPTLLLNKQSSIGYASYADLISRARSELQWLLSELTQQRAVGQ